MTSRPHDMPDDDLSRQRRKRDARLLAQTLPDDPSVTVGELVADVLAAAAAAGGEAEGEFDVRQYLAERGHEWPTIKTVVDYLERQEAARAVPSSRRRPLP